MIKDQYVDPGEARCAQGELLAQRRLRQAQRGADGEPVALDVEEHERTVVAPAARSRPATSFRGGRRMNLCGGIGMSAANTLARYATCGSRVAGPEPGVRGARGRNLIMTELLGAAGESHQKTNDGHRESRKGHKPDGMRGPAEARRICPSAIASRK